MSLIEETQRNRIAACLQAICIAKYVREDNIPCQIEQGLYIGSVGVALNRDALKSVNITHVLIVAKSLDPAFPNDFVYKKIEVLDTVDTNLSEHFDECFDFINEAKRGGGSVLVHCFAGRSRSGTIVVAYMMKQHRMSLSQALDLVRSKRPQVQPNYGFILQLQNFEKSLGGEHAYAPSQGFAPLVATQRSGVGHDDYFDVDVEVGEGGDGYGGEGSGDSDDIVIGDGDKVRAVFERPLKMSSNEGCSNESKKKKQASWLDLSNKIDSMLNNLSTRSTATVQYSESSIATPAVCIKLLRECPNVQPNTQFWFDACNIFLSKDARELFVAQPDNESRVGWIEHLVNERKKKMVP